MLTMSRKIKKVRKEIAGAVDSEEGFTLVELTMVIIISVIMLAGMVAMMTSAFDLFTTSKDLQAITDSSRRMLQSMTRQIRGQLHIVNTESAVLEEADYSDRITFYADIDNDQGTAADVESYDQAEKVSFYVENNKLMMSVQEPDGGDPVVAVLGSHVTSVQFYYFYSGDKPELDGMNPDPMNPTNSYTGSAINEEVGMVRVVIRMQKGGVKRNYYQDIYLRVVNRVE